MKSLAARLGFALLLVLLPSAGFSQIVLPPSTQPQFVNQLPNPLDNVLKPDTKTYAGYAFYHVTMNQVRVKLGLVDPLTRLPLWTTVWGYNGTFPGPTFEASSGVPVKVQFVNELAGLNGKPLPHLLPLDTTVDCGPLDSFGNPSYCRPFVRTVPHLHGGHVADHSGGNPEAWFTAGFAEVGPKWSREIYDYPNDQQAATLWYHDHAMGITRLNVYAGLAGFYLLRDENERQLQAKGILPVYPYEVPLMIQDRSFNLDGSLAYPSAPFLDEKGNPASLDPLTGKPVPSIVPEHFGDIILVNGVAWPYLQVEPRPYRFRILNGSDSRFYTLSLPAGTSFFLVGSDGGFLESPLSVKELVLAPGERADVVVDFSSSPGKSLLLTNTAAAPYPGGTAPNPRTTGKVMQFRVTKGRQIPWQGSASWLGAPMERLKPTPGLPVREVLLMEGTDEIGREMPQLGTPALGLMRYNDPATETPRAGTTEIWAIYNKSEYSYPIHLHHAQFQVIDSQRFDKDAYVPGRPETLVFLGKPQPPPPVQAGWKDTAAAPPGAVTRIAVHFDLSGQYFWMCSILSHEDHEMMRPLIVMPK